jgi:hypothetical protein
MTTPPLPLPRTAYFDFDEYLVLPSQTMGGPGHTSDPTLRTLSTRFPQHRPSTSSRGVDVSHGESKALMSSLRATQPLQQHPQMPQLQQRTVTASSQLLETLEQAQREKEQLAAAQDCRILGEAAAKSSHEEVGTSSAGAVLRLLADHSHADVVKLRQSPAVLVAVAAVHSGVPISADGAGVVARAITTADSLKDLQAEEAAAAVTTSGVFVSTASAFAMPKKQQQHLYALRWPGVRRDQRTKCFIRLPSNSAHHHPLRLLLPAVHGPGSLLVPGEWSEAMALMGDAESEGVELVPAAEGFFMHFMNLGQHLSLDAAKQTAWASAANVCDSSFATHWRDVVAGKFKTPLAVGA